MACEPFALSPLLSVSLEIAIVRPCARVAEEALGVSLRRVPPEVSVDRIKSEIRGAISARKREPLNTP